MLTNYTPPDGYRILGEKEIIKKGDYFVESDSHKKHLTKYPGSYVSFDLIYIRRIDNFKRKARFGGKTYIAPKGWRFLKNGEIIKSGDVIMNQININDVSDFHTSHFGTKQNKYEVPSLRKIP